MLGRTGMFLSNDPKDFKKGFAELNQKLVSIADGRYVLSYCSTKRKGSHKLEIEIETPGGRGEGLAQVQRRRLQPEPVLAQDASRCSKRSRR